jgi:hypothetical protein
MPSAAKFRKAIVLPGVEHFCILFGHQKVWTDRKANIIATNEKRKTSNKFK